MIPGGYRPSAGRFLAIAVAMTWCQSSYAQVAPLLVVQRVSADDVGTRPRSDNGYDESKFVRTPGVAVPGRYHVLLTHTVAEDDVEDVSRRIAAAHSLRIVRIRGQGALVEGTEQDARRASQEPLVHHVVEQDRIQERAVLTDKFVRVPDPLPGQYIVELRDVVGRPTDASVRRIADELVAHYGGSIGFAWGDLNAFSLHATESIARSLAEDPAVNSVRESERFYWPEVTKEPPDASGEMPGQQESPPETSAPPPKESSFAIASSAVADGAQASSEARRRGRIRHS